MGTRGPVAPKVVDVGAPTRLAAAIKASEAVSKLISLTAQVCSDMYSSSCLVKRNRTNRSSVLQSSA
jgi:hypothetical protein